MRADHDLAYLLRYENVAWFEDGKPCGLVCREAVRAKNIQV